MEISTIGPDISGLAYGNPIHTCDQLHIFAYMEYSHGLFPIFGIKVIEISLRSIIKTR